MSIKFIQNNYSQKFLNHLISEFKPRECEAGEIVINNGELNSNIYCIMNGTFKFELDIITDRPSENRLVLETYKNLDCFGTF